MIDPNRPVEDQFSSIKFCPLSSLQISLEDAATFLQQQNAGKRHLYILTDGSQVHANVMKIDQRTTLIHLGEKQLKRSRALAAAIDCPLQYLNDKDVDALIRHFIILYGRESSMDN